MRSKEYLYLHSTLIKYKGGVGGYKKVLGERYLHSTLIKYKE